MAAVLEVDEFAVQRAPGFAVSLPRLVLRPGEAAALCGPSGVGKTTLLRALLGLQEESLQVRGRVRVVGQEPSVLSAAAHRELLRRQVAVVSQDAMAALDPLQPIGRQVQQATGCDAAQGQQTLQELGIADPNAVWRRLPHEISGGQAQRVLLAVALLRAPQWIVADEPSASLDQASVERLAGSLQRLQQRGTAVLLATHDRRLLQRLGARTLGCVAGAFVPESAAIEPWPARRGAGAAADAPALLACDDVHVRLGGRPVLAGATLHLRRGEVVALCGPSGAGKSTLARVLVGLRSPDRGAVVRPPRRTAVQLVRQDAQASLTPGRTVASLLAEATAADVDVGALAQRLRLDLPLLQRTAAELSGGERQRAALLRALAVRPEALVLDEPLVALDRAAAAAAVELLLELRAQFGLALLWITHDEELARSVADRVLRIEEGRTCEAR